jgi:hypothetical protein
MTLKTERARLLREKLAAAERRARYAADVRARPQYRLKAVDAGEGLSAPSRGISEAK